MTERYLEDFAVGQTYGSGRLQIDEERIKRFASEFDPQPFLQGGHQHYPLHRMQVLSRSGGRPICRI